MTTMLAGVVAAPGTLAIEPVAAPVVRRPTDVLLDVRASGVCGTDLHVIRDPEGVGVALGTVLGHEFVGVVREVGAAVSHVERGDRVVVAPVVSCGACEGCHAGRPHTCEEAEAYGFTQPGGFAPHVVVAASSVYRVADHVPDWRAALVEPLSTVLHGLKRAQPFPGERALVIGGGPIGLLFVGVLAHAGLDVVVIEPSPARADAARAMGAVAVLAPGPDAVAHVRELTGGAGPELVVDAVGTQLDVALAAVRAAGRIVLFGVARGARLDVDPRTIQTRDVQILGANVGSFVFAPALRLVEQGRIDFGPVVSHRVALADLPEAVALQQRGEATKALVEL
jgi:threonine dehydrogenase-like Zn-dependent dehydrogenase